MSDLLEHDQAAARRSHRSGGSDSAVPDHRFRALFEQSPLGLVLYAPDGRLLAANQAIRKTVSRPRATSYNVLQDDYLIAAGVMGEIRRAFAGEFVDLHPSTMIRRTLLVRPAGNRAGCAASSIQ